MGEREYTILLIMSVLISERKTLALSTSVCGRGVLRMQNFITTNIFTEAYGSI